MKIKNSDGKLISGVKKVESELMSLHLGSDRSDRWRIYSENMAQKIKSDKDIFLFISKRIFSGQ